MGDEAKRGWWESNPQKQFFTLFRFQFVRYSVGDRCGRNHDPSEFEKHVFSHIPVWNSLNGEFISFGTYTFRVADEFYRRS